MKAIVKTTLILGMFTVMVSCSKDDDDDNTQGNNTETLNLDISGLENLGSDYVYEGWMMVDGAPVTTGRFSVNDAGDLSQTSFALDATQLSSATAFILTIEPKVGDDPAPSSVHILAGDFEGDMGTMSIDHAAALGTDFSTIDGKFILATPSTMDMTDENEGVWFIDNSSGTAMPGLDLPTLPTGWVYEGWAVIEGNAVSTGRFTAADMADMDGNPFKGMEGVPGFPGEDFIMGMSNGVDFSLAQPVQKVVLSVEPEEDNSAAPFTLKPLVSMDLPATAPVHMATSLNQNLMFPEGSFTR